MNDGPFRRWVQRSGRLVRITLPFGDIMEIALALLGLSPSDLAKLGWTFEDRKRLINHLLASGKQAQRMAPNTLDHLLLAVRLPVHDIHRLQCFAQR